MCGKAGQVLLDPFIFQEKLEMGQHYVDQIEHVGWAQFGLRNDPAPGGYLGLWAEHKGIHLTRE